MKKNIIENIKSNITKENIIDYLTLGITSVFSGVIVSLSVLLFLIISHKIVNLSNIIYQKILLKPYFLIPVIFFIFLLSILYSFLFMKHPTLKGSGLSKTIGYLREKNNFFPAKAAFSAIFLTQFSFLLGLSLGDEAPSIIIAVIVGYYFNKVIKNKKHKKEIEIASAGCGFSIAFFSPFAAIFYIFEDLVEKRKLKVIFSSIISIISGYTICRLFVIKNLIPGYFQKFRKIQELSNINVSLRMLIFLISGGVIIGFCAFLFNNFMSTIVKLMRKPNRKKYFLHIFFCTTASVLLNIIAPQVHGSGTTFLNFILNENQTYISILIFSILLIISVVISYLSYMPGGFVFPIISVGYAFSALITQIITNSIFNNDISKLQNKQNFYFLILFIFAIVFFGASYNLKFTIIFMYLEITNFNLSTSYLILFALIPAILVQKIFNMPSLSEIFIIESKKIQPNPHKMPVYRFLSKTYKKIKIIIKTSRNKK